MFTVSINGNKSYEIYFVGGRKFGRITALLIFVEIYKFIIFANGCTKMPLFILNENMIGLNFSKKNMLIKTVVPVGIQRIISSLT